MGFLGDLIGGAIKKNAGALARKAAGYGASRLGLGTGATKALENIAGGLGDRAGNFVGDKAAGAIKFRKGGVVLMKRMRRARGKSVKGSIAAKRKMAAVRRFKKRR
jgi:hypothetical protein